MNRRVRGAASHPGVPPQPRRRQARRVHHPDLGARHKPRLRRHVRHEGANTPQPVVREPGCAWVPCCAVPCRAVLCCAVLCCAVLCCAVLCFEYARAHARTHARTQSCAHTPAHGPVRTRAGQVVPVVCDSNGNIDVNDVRIKAEMYKDTLSCAMITSAPAGRPRRRLRPLTADYSHLAVTQRSRSAHAAVTQRRLTPRSQLPVDARRVRGVVPRAVQDHPRVRRPRLHGRRQHERAGARRCDSPAGPSVGGRWDPSVTRGGVCRALHRSGWSSPDRSARTCATSTCTRRSASRTAAAAPASARSASSRCAARLASAQAAPLVSTQAVLRLPQRVGAGRAALRFAAVAAHGRACSSSTQQTSAGRRAPTAAPNRRG